MQGKHLSNRECIYEEGEREREQLTSAFVSLWSNVYIVAYNSNSGCINISGNKMSKEELMCTCTCIPYRMVR